MKVNSFSVQLNEGLYDPGIFKAFFLAGGPGSGKSFVTSSAFAGTGLKLVNSDVKFERDLKKANLSLKMPDEEEYFRNIIRQRAKMTAITQLDTYIKGRLGLVIDSTGRDYDMIARNVNMLKQLGYDCYMIFVNTSLEVALERNVKRSRSVPENIVRTSWATTQNNIGKYQKLFQPANFYVIDNSSSEKELVTTTLSRCASIVRRTMNQPHGFIAKQWIDRQLRIKKRT